MGELVDLTGAEVGEVWVGFGSEGGVGGSREGPLEEPDGTPRRGDFH